ncbi:hypothetical protein [Limnohabitans sp.]|uniref:hypothetical protein n=1 Tax=Limnohabitans sp. TaxID=1907725 RepID=UPI0037C0F1C4
MRRPQASTWRALAPAWRLGWPRLWRDRWRWLARRWAFALAGFGLGLLGVGSMQLQALEALWESDAQVQDLRAQLLVQQNQASNRPGANPNLNAPTGPPQVMAWWPVQGTQSAVWPQLERLFAQHGVRLLSLRPEPASPMGAWPSQAVALRLQARFDDWVAVWAAMNTHGPIWGIERLRITPQGGGVAIEAVLRLWLSSAATSTPGGGGALALGALFPSPAPVGLRPRAGGPVFLTTPLPVVASSVAAPNLKPEDPVSSQTGAGVPSRTSLQEGRASVLQQALLSPDPADWPLEQVRLAGIWQHAHDAQLILLAGPHWVLARVGQRIGTQGHVVQSIHAREVHLRAAQGPMQVIGFEKAKP